MTSELESVVKNEGTRVYVLGAAVGLGLGLISAYFYLRVGRELDVDAKPRQIKTMDLLRLAVALLGIVRHVTDLGSDR